MCLEKILYLFFKPKVNISVDLLIYATSLVDIDSSYQNNSKCNFETANSLSLHGLLLSSIYITVSCRIVVDVDAFVAIRARDFHRGVRKELQLRRSRARKVLQRNFCERQAERERENMRVDYLNFAASLPRRLARSSFHPEEL